MNVVTSLMRGMLCLVLCLTGFLPISVDAEDITISFDSPSESGDNEMYLMGGVYLIGGMTVTPGSNFDRAFPAHSGTDVFLDNGLVTVLFDRDVTGYIHRIGAYVTGKNTVYFTAYDLGGNVLQTVITPGRNFVGAGEPNYYIEIDSPEHPISLVEFRRYGYPQSFTLDDLTIDADKWVYFLDAPLYLQTDARWSSDAYGAEGWSAVSSNRTIEYYGCAMTAAASVVSYHSVYQHGRSVDPAELNTWLRTQRLGYVGGYINWFKVAEFARSVLGIQLWYRGSVSNYDDPIGPSLAAKEPLILDLGGHFVLAHGLNTSGDIYIRDPMGFSATLDNHYHGEYYGGRKFSTVASRKAGVLSYMIISSDSLDEFSLVLPDGTPLTSSQGVLELEYPVDGKYAIDGNIPQRFYVAVRAPTGIEWEGAFVTSSFVLDNASEIPIKVAHPVYLPIISR